MRIAREPEEWIAQVALVCLDCRQLVPIGEVEEKGDGTAISRCCGAPCGYVEPSHTLADRGPAWASYTAAPRVLLALPKDALSVSAKLVALALFDYLDLPEIRPKQATIAAKVGLSERTVRDALDQLESLDLIVRSRRHGPGGNRAPDRIDVSGLVRLLNRLAEEAAARHLPEGSSGRCTSQPAAFVTPTGNFWFDVPAEAAGEIENLEIEPEREKKASDALCAADGSLSFPRGGA